MDTNMKHPDNRREQGWVVIASLILAGIAASVTVTWARHAVLAKSSLEMAHGASESEEAARSGINHAREQMRQGDPPGSIADGEEDVVLTEDGHVVTIEREVEDHDRRKLKTKAHKVKGSYTDEAACKAKAKVVPESNAGGKPTRFRKNDGAGLAGAGNVHVITGTTTYANTELIGTFILETGANLTLDNVVVRGVIVTRSGLSEDDPKLTGSSRPSLHFQKNVRILPDASAPDIAIVGPDLVITADSGARLGIEGQVIADEMDLPCRGTIVGMVTTETSSNISSKCKRPGFGRGPQDWSTQLEAGAERVTKISFPAEDYTEAEMDAMEGCDVF